MELLIFIIVVVAVIWGILRMTNKWSRKSAEKVEEIVQSTRDDAQQPLSEPPPISEPKADMTNDELRRHIDQQFRHVEQLIGNLHEQQEQGRIRNVVRLGEWVAEIQNRFVQAGANALTYLLIGVAVSIALTLLTGWEVIFDLLGLGTETTSGKEE